MNASFIRAVLSALVAFATAAGAAPCPTISEQPQSVAILQCQTATFQVTANGSLPLTFQWYRDGNVIAGATNSFYSPSCQSGWEFFVTVSNACGVVTSAVAYLNCLLDVVPPTLVQARVLKDLRTVVLWWYPCPLFAPVANEAENYAISGGVLVTNATLTSGTNVLLRTTPLAPATRYEVTVEYMEDVEGNILLEPVTIGFWTPPYQLSFVRTNGQLRLSWPTNAILQQSLSVTGVWADVSNEVSALTVSNGPTRFFRVRFP